MLPSEIQQFLVPLRRRFLRHCVHYTPDIRRDHGGATADRELYVGINIRELQLETNVVQFSERLQKVFRVIFVVSVNQRNVYHVLIQGSFQNCLEETVRRYFNGYGVSWDHSRRFSEQDRIQQIVRVIFRGRILGSFRVPLTLRHGSAHPLGTSRFWIGNNFLQV